MNILITGANGQVGWELARATSVLGNVVACDRSGLDLTRPETIRATLDRFRPEVVFNAAAYTAVDKAEDEEALATRVNGDALGEIARWARGANSLVVHYSTDYVFDGTQPRPYAESDDVSPINAYGRSKLAGERILAAEHVDWLTFRTTWVYGSRGKNFLLTMLKLASERETLRVVNDQFGAPTSSRLIAELSAHALVRAMAERASGNFQSGLFHMTAAGRTSWHGFASAIIHNARSRLTGGQIKATQVDPIPSSEYPLPAKRPGNSSLDCSKFDSRFGLHRPDWHDSMLQTLDDALGR
ncbi:dTDP-4-dehydrorhamnose reductase [Paraburkholderia saeva]|uniref:dTDP-4-dehydrorhamnose reductase n=1 Tax=Paraburkholderia saeva TaxID=2777537 RepID=UPI001D38ECE7|nr:dTDP-4-dehydrorhamnose reductase [Paraburkholderia saeva]CAG4901030.1 dTDP-4-dehydrorhamnose reductase [Paraburkholderia saeva]